MKHSTYKKMKVLRSKIFNHEKVEYKISNISSGESAKESGVSGSSYNAKVSINHGKIKSNKKCR